MKISTTVLGVIGLLTALFGAIGATSWWLIDEEQTLLDKIGESATKVSVHNLELLVAVKDIQLNVIQVQQWLTDISATRGLDGLNDGFDEAAAQADAFAVNAERARATAEILGMTQVVAAIDDAVARFPAYYAAGQEMARTYIDEGPAGGNAMMSSFDEQAAAIAESIEALVSATREGVGVTVGELDQAMAEVIAGADVLVTMAVVGAVLGIAVCLLTGVLAVRGLTNPIRAITRSMQKLTRNETDVALPALARSDEIGQMATALDVFRDAVQDRERMRLEQDEMKARQEEERRATMCDMADTIEASTRDALKTVEDLVGRLSGQAKGVGSTADSMAQRASEVADSSKVALSNAQSVSSASEQLSASIAEIHRTIEKSKQVAGAAVDRSDETRTVVARLAEVGDGIGNVVQLIKEIAEQTNLLALNATIEAARAGEAGKGFAVVASEVKSLANQTAQSTSEIEQRVSEIRAVSEEASVAINSVGEAISEIDANTSAVVAAITQQRDATDEIARNVAESSGASQNVNIQIESVSESAHSNRDSATSLECDAAALADAVRDFGMTVTRLIRTSSDVTDRRQYERFDVDVEATVAASGARTHTRLVDISSGGLRLADETSFKPGDCLSVEIAGTGHNWTGRVVAVSPRGTHLKFEETQSIDVERLRSEAIRRAA